MNQSIISGNLTADIETRELGEKHLSKFTLASNQGESVVFLPVQAWNMEHLSRYLRKGSRVLVSGPLKQENWENKAGEKRTRIVLTAYQVEFLDAQTDDSGRSSRERSRRESRRSRAA